MSVNFSAVIIASMVLLGANGASRAAQPEGRYDHAGDLVFGATSTTSGDPRLKEVADYVTAHIKPWIGDPLLVRMINAQDAETKKLKQAQIDTLDIAWLERSDPELIEARMNNELSTFLKTKKAAGDGVILEIFVFDNKGLNVGQTDLTEDYVQGDEAKYWKSFGAGPDAMVVEKVAPDGGRPHISQASVTIKDPGTGKAIGAMTIGIDYDELAKAKK